ncbi:hypothetical protein CXF80_04735 [Shewanella sp. Actino-trap-3]|nr:hypothetical protein CXF80_04735 [Shewanella sp. Actino-trap-3]
MTGYYNGISWTQELLNNRLLSQMQLSSNKPPSCRYPQLTLLLLFISLIWLDNKKTAQAGFSGANDTGYFCWSLVALL